MTTDWTTIGTGEMAGLNVTEDIRFFLAAVATISTVPNKLVHVVPTGHHSRVYFIIDI